MLNLLEELGRWEADTGRKSTVIFIPQAQDEKIVMAKNGRIVPEDSGIEPQEILVMAMNERKRG